jgi:hypothetical protein
MAPSIQPKGVLGGWSITPSKATWEGRGSKVTIDPEGNQLSITCNRTKMIAKVIDMGGIKETGEFHAMNVKKEGNVIQLGRWQWIR